MLLVSVMVGIQVREQVSSNGKNLVKVVCCVVKYISSVFVNINIVSIFCVEKKWLVMELIRIGDRIVVMVVQVYDQLIFLVLKLFLFNYNYNGINYVFQINYLINIMNDSFVVVFIF